MERTNHIDSEPLPGMQSLSRREIRDLLACYLAGGMTAKQVRDWAESIEFSERVCYERGFEEEIERTIFMMANPELIDGSLNSELAAHLIRYLDRLNLG